MRERPPVLVVDDQPSIRRIIVELLGLEGYPTATAAHGQEALDFLVWYPGNYVILLGLNMPVMNGWKFMEHLDAMPEERVRHKIIIVSGAAYLPKARDLRVEGRVQKPFTTGQLLNALEAVCA